MGTLQSCRVYPPNIRFEVKKVSNSDSDTHKQIHWLSVMTLEDGRLIYGCLVIDVEEWSTIESQSRTQKIGETEVRLYEELLCTDALENFRSKLQRELKLDLSVTAGPVFTFSDCRTTLRTAFGRSKRLNEIYVQAEFPTLEVKTWSDVLCLVEAEYGGVLPAAPERIGAFEVIDSDRVKNRTRPIVRFEQVRSKDDDGTENLTEFRLFRIDELDEDIEVLVELSLAGDLVYTRLLSLPRRGSVNGSSPPYSGYKTSVFDGSGVLVDEQDMAFLNQINLSQSMSTGAVELHDRLSQSVQGESEETIAKARTVRPTTHTLRSSIGVTDKIFDRHRILGERVMERLAPEKRDDSWFERGIVEEVEVLEHLNNLINSSRISHCTIVDPFFGVDAVERVIGRLESIEVNIQVITSLSDINPDTGVMDSSILGNVKNKLDQLRSAGRIIGARSIEFSSVVSGNEQAFHDRYLILKTHEGALEAFLLSNSFNRMAGKWPFCMSKLDSATAHQVAEYVERELLSASLPSGKQRNFYWPNSE